MNLRAQRNVSNRQSISGQNVGIFSARDHPAYFQAHRSDDVTLLAIQVRNQRNIRRAIRIVFDLGDASGYAILVTLEIDHPIETLVAATASSHGDAPIVVAS